jgi:hypothetical protein
MDERPGTRRRIASILVALVAAGATIATSAPHIESRLDGTSVASVTLDDATPRAVGRFVLNLPREALPVGTTALYAPTGTVTFTIQPSTTGIGPSSPVAITATAVGVPQKPTIDLGASSWPIEQLCRVEEPCRREFEVSAEWLEPKDGTSIQVPVRAALALRYENWEALPTGATATWDDEAFVPMAPAPAVSAQADLGSVTIGRDSPMAARRIVLRGSAALLGDGAGVDVTAFLRAESSTGARENATVTLVEDGGTLQDTVQAGTIIQPFTGCPKAATCERGFTVFARWRGGAPEEAVHLDWSFDARARFPGATAVPEGAALTAEIADQLDLGLGSARLQATAKGSFELPGGNNKAGHVRLLVTAPPLGNAYLGAAPPAVATVRLRAALKDPATPAKLRAFISSPEDYTYSSVPLADDGTELGAAVFALGGCEAGVACTGYIEITVDSATGREGTISWDVAVELPVPRPQLAVGDLRIEVSAAR